MPDLILQFQEKGKETQML